MMGRTPRIVRVPRRGKRRVTGVLLVHLLLTALSGCAPLAPLPTPSQRYQCEGGREFRLSVAAGGDSAILEISGMSFRLQAEHTSGPGERYSCSELTLWRDGELARVDWEGVQRFTKCRLQP